MHLIRSSPGIKPQISIYHTHESIQVRPDHSQWMKVRKAIMDVRGSCRTNTIGNRLIGSLGTTTPPPLMLLHSAGQLPHARNRMEDGEKKRRTSICSIASWLDCELRGAAVFPREMHNFYRWIVFTPNACLWLSALLSNNYRSTFEPILNKSLNTTAKRAFNSRRMA